VSSQTAAAEPIARPDAAQTSGALTVLYDGTCGFCTRQARFAQRLGGGVARVQLLSTAIPGVLESRLGHLGITRESTNRQMFVEDGATGRLYGGAAAVARIVREVPVIGLVGWFYYVPGIKQLAGATYKLIARNRHRLSRLFGWQPLPDDSCASGDCALPTAH